MSQPTILVIDDSEEIRTLLARALGTLGSVEMATDGVDALKRIEERRYDLVLLDLHMPKIDGFMTLRSLRENAHNADTPVLVITADVAFEAREEALRLGATQAISKPFSPSAVRTLAEALLTSSTTISEP